MSVQVKQEYVEHNDSSNDGGSDDEDGVDRIFDFVNDSVKKKIMNKFKKKKALVEENSKKELDEMIGIHKNFTSGLDQKHNQEILKLKNKHTEANMKMRNKHCHFLGSFLGILEKNREPLHCPPSLFGNKQ